MLKLTSIITNVFLKKYMYTFQSSNGTQWFSLPSYYTAPGTQQNFRVQNPVPNYLISEASVSYQYQSLNPVTQFVAPETTTIHQYGLTDYQPAYHHETSGTFFNQVTPPTPPPYK